MLPTTKAKQRQFVHDLIIDVHSGTASRNDIIIRLNTLLLQLRNRPPVKRGDPVAQTVTPAVRAAIRKLYRQYPTITNQTIAELTNLNTGRVSEVLAGKRL